MGIEIERKYIIKLPDFEKSREMSGYECSKIVQVYMPTSGGVSHRIRRRDLSSKTVFTETKKHRLDGMSAIEEEREITEAEYESLFAARDRTLNVITKTRHTFIYKNQLYEIDVYPEWRVSCIMETELNSRDSEALIPDFITVIKQVTGNFAYSNHAMAKSFPPELEEIG